jgi:hypothetical protein
VRVNDQAMRGRLVPDTGFLLSTSAGPVECMLEWDRGTETTARLTEKLVLYRTAESRLRSNSRQPRSVLFVVPGPGRVETLEKAFRAFAAERDQRNGDYQVSLRLLATARRDRPRPAAVRSPGPGVVVDRP